MGYRRTSTEGGLGEFHYNLMNTIAAVKDIYGSTQWPVLSAFHLVCHIRHFESGQFVL